MPGQTTRGASAAWPRAAIVVVWLGVQSLALANALLHPPVVAYDSIAHLAYVEVLARLRLPTSAESSEYFSPPLPYVLPAIARAAGLSPLASAKVAQVGNVAISAALCWWLLRLCEALRPGASWLRPGALGLVASLPVYYKMLSQPIRGEVWLAWLAVVVAHRLLLVLRRGTLLGKDALVLATLAGGLTLARQWAIPLLAGVGVFLLLTAAADPARRRAALLALAATAGGALLLGGWFYLSLAERQGSAIAFNRARLPFSLGNQDRDFYLGTGNGKLFTDPVRPAFPNQLLPIAYSETWGDYWCYLLVRGATAGGEPLYGPELESALQSPPRAVAATNHRRVAAYLGRVNRLALLPTALLAAGLLWGGWGLGRWLRRGGAADEARGLLFLLVAASLAGYFWFLVSFPNPGKGDTIKAGYMLQVFPLLACLAGDLLASLRVRQPLASRALAAALLVVGVHNLGACSTRFGELDTSATGLITVPAAAAGAAARR